MVLLPMLALSAAAAMQPADCASLRGTSGTTVVDQATAVVPAPEWRVETTSFYKPEPVRAPLCRVVGRIEGSIGFELWLPMQWNGRLLGAGVGGDAGVINYRDMSLRVGQGFAVVSTDSGHKVENARWMREPKARVDYEHRAVHLTAQSAKALVTRFYGRAAARAYFTGCSGGGRQALKEMENYPGDYDGVIAGAPGPYMPLQSVRMLWFSLAQQRDPKGALADADWSLYERRATDACDPLDGVRDGIVENPARCRFATRTLLCAPGRTADCLTAPKLAMLDRIIAPLPDEQGRAMDGGLFPGVRTRPGPPSPLLRAMWADAVYDDPKWDALTFRRTADLAAVNRVMPELRADRTAIAPFTAAGHKAIIYQGWQDPSVNAGPTIAYYAALARANGGLAALQRSVRLFMVPGMYHCRGGPGVDLFGASAQAPLPAADPEHDMLWALIAWVEQGDAPKRLAGRKEPSVGPGVSRTLCAFPASATYDRKGPSEDAASFRCSPDPALQRLLSR